MVTWEPNKSARHGPLGNTRHHNAAVKSETAESAFCNSV